MVSKTERYPSRNDLITNLFGYVSTSETIVHFYGGDHALYLLGRSMRAAYESHTLTTGKERGGSCSAA